MPDDQLTLDNGAIMPNETLHYAVGSPSEARETTCAAWENPGNNQVCGWGGLRPGAGRKFNQSVSVPLPEPEAEHWY
jgi:hypothetical protein